MGIPWENEDVLWEVDLADVEVLAFGRTGCSCQWHLRAELGLELGLAKFAQEFGMAREGQAPSPELAPTVPLQSWGCSRPSSRVCCFSTPQLGDVFSPFIRTEFCSDVAVTCGKQQELSSVWHAALAALCFTPHLLSSLELFPDGGYNNKDRVCKLDPKTCSLLRHT